MEVAIVVIEEALELIRKFKNDNKVLVEQFGIIAKYAKGAQQYAAVDLQTAANSRIKQGTKRTHAKRTS